MMSLLKPSFWLQLFLSTFLTMLCIYIIKKVSGAYNIPLVSTVAKEV